MKPGQTKPFSGLYLPCDLKILASKEQDFDDQPLSPHAMLASTSYEITGSYLPRLSDAYLLVTTYMWPIRVSFGSPVAAYCNIADYKSLH